MEVKEPHDDDSYLHQGKKFTVIAIYSFIGAAAVVVLFFVIKDYFDRRALRAARLERVTVSIYDTSNPPQFDQSGCPICLQDFANAQPYSSLPCRHIFCKKCLSKVINRDIEVCPDCKVKILD
jgi:hypothetical protein